MTDFAQIPGRDESGNVISRAPVGVLINRSGSIVAAGVSQQLVAENATRKYLLLQNVSSSQMGVSLVGAAGAVGSAGTLTLEPGDCLRFADGFVPTGAISIRSASAAANYTCYEA